jgi:protein TonB
MTEPQGAPEPVIPMPAAVSVPNQIEAMPAPREPVKEEAMISSLDELAPVIPTVPGEYRIAASGERRMGKPVGMGGGNGRGSGGIYVAPRYLKNPPPAYPLAARLSGREGIVLLAVVVNEEGRVAEVAVLRSSGDAALDRAAAAAVALWTFHPATAGGRTIAARVEVPVRFRLK